MSVPVIAVVGFVNMGKSSLVAALTETDAVAISPQAGTTRDAERYACRVEGEALFELVDTPGFQAARRALGWLEHYLEARAEQAVTGPDAIAAFLAAHDEDDPLFANEVRLLRAIGQSSGILYVADANLPYKARYEAEMRILARTAKPRLAIVNLRGEAEHRETWRQALAANFGRVHAIDVVRADPAERRAVLRAMRDVEPTWQPAFDLALARLADDDDLRRGRVADELVDLIASALRARRCAGLPMDSERSATERRLRNQLKAELVARESACRRRVEQLYGFGELQRQEASLAVVDEDLFADRVWRLLGLSKRRLIAASVAAGAGTGGAIDLGVGGLSLATGALIGAGLGLAGGLAASRMRFGVSVLGRDLLGQGEQLCVFAPRSLKWASVILDRALLHHRLVRARSHADRSQLAIEHRGDRPSLLDGLGGDSQKRLAALVDATGRDEGPLDEELRAQWRQWLLGALRATAPSREEQGS